MKKEKTSVTIRAEDVLCELDRKTSGNEIQDRAKSLKSVGQIHSVKIQPIEHEKYKYRVVAGRRSFLALTKILGKDELKMPEEISFIEGDPEIIAFAENDERTNLSLSEQIEKLNRLSERFGIAELSSHLSHSAGWIAARIRLNELSDIWKDAMKKSFFPEMTIGHYEAVAKYPKEIQDEAYEFCKGLDFEEGLSIAQLENLLMENFTFQIRNVPWNENGEYQGCGTCPACIDRKNKGYLFEEMNDDKKAICQNRKHHIEKMNEYIAVKVEEIRKNAPETVLVSQNSYYPEGFPLAKEEIYPSHAWTKTGKKKNAKRAFIVNGPMAGSFINVEINESYLKKPEGMNGSGAGSGSQDGIEGQSEKKPRSLAERKELKNRQRQRHAITTLIAYLESGKYEIPERDVLFRLIACLGVDSICLYDYSNPQSNVQFGTFGLSAYQEISEKVDLDKQVWKKVLVNILKDLKQGQTGSVAARWEEAQLIGKITGFDLGKAFEEAISALPDPKSWEKLEKDNPPQENAA